MSQLICQSLLGGDLRGPIAPVRGPFLFMNHSRLLGLELWPVLARNLHRVVLRHFVFVVSPSEKATLSEGGGEERRGAVERRGVGEEREVEGREEGRRG